jgi:hypothetical protein
LSRTWRYRYAAAVSGHESPFTAFSVLDGTGPYGMAQKGVPRDRVPGADEVVAVARYTRFIRWTLSTPFSRSAKYAATCIALVEVESEDDLHAGCPFRDSLPGIASRF